MANAQHAPAQHAPEHKAEKHKKADPAAAQYVVNLTPEQYEAATKDPSSRPQMELGGTGTAKASFKDAAGGDVKIDSSEWVVTGGVKVTPDEKDPASAKIEPTAPGAVTITVTATTVDGSAQASTDMMVVEKVGKPVTGTIEIAVQAPAKAKA